MFRQIQKNKMLINSLSMLSILGTPLQNLDRKIKVESFIKNIETLPYENYRFEIYYDLHKDSEGTFELLEYFYKKNKISEDDINMITEILYDLLPRLSFHGRDCVLNKESFKAFLEINESYDKNLKKKGYQESLGRLIVRCSVVLDNKDMFIKYFDNLVLKNLDKTTNVIYSYLIDAVRCGSLNVGKYILENYLYLLKNDDELYGKKKNLEDILIRILDLNYSININDEYGKRYLRKDDEKSNETVLLSLEIIKYLNEENRKFYLNKIWIFSGRNPVDIDVICKILNNFTTDKRKEKLEKLLCIMCIYENFSGFNKVLQLGIKYDITDIYKALLSPYLNISGKHKFIEKLIKEGYPLPTKYLNYEESKQEIYKLVHSDDGGHTLKILIDNGLKISNSDLLKLIAKYESSNPRLNG